MYSLGVELIAEKCTILEVFVEIVLGFFGEFFLAVLTPVVNLLYMIGI
jgi:hypothetical protein